MLSISQLIPPTFAFGFSRMDSAASNKAVPYMGDCRWFRDHPKRKAYLRIEYINEFDYGIAAEHRRDLPKLHVLVVQLAPGMHLLFPPFRTSDPFWCEPKSDHDVAVIMAEMGKRGGFDYDEMQRFASVHCSDYPQPTQGKQAIQ